MTSTFQVHVNLALEVLRAVPLMIVLFVVISFLAASQCKKPEV